MDADAPASARSSRWPGLIIMGVGLALGLAAGVIVFLGPVGVPNAAGTPATPAPAPVAGAPAPDFSLQDLQGNTVRLADQKGQVVAVNFWATWCGPCRLEMPALQARYDALKDKGFMVLAVNLDEPLEDVAGFARELSLTFPVLLDPGAQVNDLYRVRGYPTTFFINRDGLIDREHVGILSDGQLDNYLAALGLIDD